jgi:hypothetical protein
MLPKLRKGPAPARSFRRSASRSSSAAAWLPGCVRGSGGSEGGGLDRAELQLGRQGYDVVV